MYKIMYINPKTGFVEFVNIKGTWDDCYDYILEKMMKDGMMYPVVFDESDEIADHISARNLTMY